MKGEMISFEGINGAGKTEVMKLVRRHLIDQGYRVYVTREPGGTSLGEELRRLLLDPYTQVAPAAELMMMCASRAQHVEAVIKPVLARGEIVLCDRFHASTVSFQHYGRGIPLDQVRQANTIALAGFMPSLTLIFDVDTQIAARRQVSRGQAKEAFEVAGDSFTERVRNGYLQQAAEDPKHFRVIDASGSMEQSFMQSIQVIEALLRSQSA